MWDEEELNDEKGFKTELDDGLDDLDEPFDDDTFSYKEEEPEELE
ncbi:MAG: hypothetical protein WC662_03460 [Candidatus Paceibacterota bacterium]|jgi:hypothetical protein